MPKGFKTNTLKKIIIFLLLSFVLTTQGFAKSEQQEKSGLHKKSYLNEETLNVEDIYKEIHPVDEQGRICKDIVKKLKYNHYHALPVDDEFSSRVFDKYISDLDSSRIYFYGDDIKNFEPLRNHLDEAYLSGDLQAAYLIYNKYYHRIIERLVALIRDVEDGISDIDFSKNEEIESERETSPWFNTQKEMDEYWRKRLKNSVLSLKLSGKKVEDIVDLLSKRYRSQLNRIAQTNSEDIFRIYMNAFCQCYDPHTTYFSPRVSEDFDIQMSLSLEGIGAVLQSKNEFTVISRLVPAGPADKSNLLKPGDRIVSVGQGTDGELVDVIGWRLDEVVQLIRGPKKTVVRLEIIPANAIDDHQTKIVNITRNTVKLEEQAAQKEIVEKKEGETVYKIGIITIPAFYLDFDGYRNGDTNHKSTTRDVSRILNEFKTAKVDGVMIDLRDNGGGALQEANTLTGLFIERGPTVQVKNANGRVGIERDMDPSILYDGPLVVIVNRMSASASEIFAGAIQDYNRGLIVGSQTFGKGTVQRLDPLIQGQLKLTIAKFYRISGNSTQHKGVIPDIIFPSVYDIEKIGESAYPEALKWDKIRPTAYYPYPQLDDVIFKLRMDHDKRIVKDPDFQYLIAGINRVNEVRQKTTVSLNEKVRETEIDSSKKWRLEVENKRRVEKGLPPVKKLEELDNYQDEFDTESAPEQTENDKDEPDPIMIESENILVDFISLVKETGKAMTSSAMRY